MRKWYGLLMFVALAGGGSARATMNGPDASLMSDGGAPGVDAASDGVGGSSDSGGDADACAKTCPTAEPAVGDPCDLSMECEYGDDPRFECNRQYRCQAGHFQILQGADGGCPTVLAAGCPPTRASLTAGAACTPLELQCTYAEGECQCEPSGADGGSSWFCLPENTLVSSDAVCPAPRPRLGTPCSLQWSVSCSYESNCTFQSCSPCGYWGLGYVPCGEVPPPLPMDGGTEGGGDSSVDASFGGDGASAERSAVGSSGGCGCGVTDHQSGAGAGAGVILGIALFARRRRSDESRRSAA